MGRPTTYYDAPHLAAWRIARVLTQEELADKAGVHRATIARLEAGGTARTATIRQLAAALGIDTDTLMHQAPAPR